MTTEERRNKNWHTLSELEADNNKTIFINESKGSLVMKRGKTFTTYILVEDRYWTPVNAYTQRNYLT